MQIDQSYLEHIKTMENLKMSDDFQTAREPYKDDFEKIYSKAKEDNIVMSTAKEFLNSLSQDELSTLQHYSGLADDINVKGLNDEGSYNLLLHHYEKYDFNGDGFVSDGIAKTSGMIPQNMPNDMKKAMVETFNSMDDKESSMMILLMFPLKIDGMGNILPNDKVDYDSLKNRVDHILDPLNQKYSSEEFRAGVKTFWETFEDKYSQNKEENTYHKNSLDIENRLTKAKITSDIQST